MRIVNVSSLQEGDILGKSIFDERFELMLASGYKLNSEIIESIIKRGFSHVYLMDELTKDIEPEEVIDERIRNITNQRLAKTFENVKNNLSFDTVVPEEIKKRIEETSKSMPLLHMEDVRKNVNDVISEIYKNQKHLFVSLPTSPDNEQDYRHAIDTTVLAILIGRMFKFDLRELKLLGTAAMVHDVGKNSFVAIQAKKDSERTREEKMILREHPVYSMMILKGSDENTFVEQLAVLQHHEQADGSGYPQCLKSSGNPPLSFLPSKSHFIHRHAEILAVANTFDNLVSGSYDGFEHTPEEAINRFIQKDAGVWNEHVVKALVDVVQCYPRGASVRIARNSSNKYVGFRGVISESNHIAQSKPTILLTHNDLNKPIPHFYVDFRDEKYMKLIIEM
ncbi:MAG: HD domain-containing phosphohydrolase [Candidatus Electryonea clarkiae]|nr:HD domain-containing phosphohydrolase [Candidatus Electryonea clarkiae]MDP8288807.1 HD domain-containing phosphohydrolase [Candidatus Electryonea clarkiae]